MAEIESIRLSIFLGLLTLLGLLEIIIPRRPLQRGIRWVSNLSVVVVNSVLLRVIYGAGALAAAFWALQHQWGLFNLIKLPYWVELIAAVILLDLVIYWQHRLTHRIPLLWRLHRMHHSDNHLDVTTALRFHPLEILLSMALKFLAIVLIGASINAVLIFEILLNSGAMFNHSNIRLHPWLDKLLRLVIVTPDMHRVHHSTIVQEHNRNYGFLLSCWDHIFNSYQDQPVHGHDKMNIGLTSIKDAVEQRLDKLLTVPFRNP